jgi:hypothetical protein
MFRFRSFSFYKYANPSIKNGGFLGDAKSAIYPLLPSGTYPATTLLEKGPTINYYQKINEQPISFPKIVKPDVGLRGIGVAKVNSLQELIEYAQAAKENFLIQDIISFPNEMGLFYCRMPNESTGKITGITMKKFLTIEGNGVDTIEQLLRKSPRFEMQISKLKHQINLSAVVPQGEKICLVPFGNHNRGTEFIDGKELITPKLEQTFDQIFRNVEGFYYGRADIRFNTFEELENGINFSIIELNGAKSEPTHIYDPKYSFWHGQREIFRHQRIFKRIIQQSILMNKELSS